VTEIVDRAMAALQPEQAMRDAEALRREEATLAAELDRLATAISEGGVLLTLLAAVKAKEGRRAAIANELARLDACVHVAQSRIDDWQGVLFRHPVRARQILRKLLLDGPLLCEPIPGQRRSHRFTGNASIGKLLNGLVAGRRLSTSLASPTGLDAKVQGPLRLAA
jgi:hypothetical protein